MADKQTEINVVKAPYGLVAYLPSPDDKTFLYAAMIHKNDPPARANLLRAGTASGFTYDHGLFFYLEEFDGYGSGDWVGKAKERTKPPHKDAVLDRKRELITFKKGSLEARTFEALDYERVLKPQQNRTRTGR